MFHVYQIGAPVIALLILRKLWLWRNGSTTRTTDLKGPPSQHFLLGLNKYIHEAENPGKIYEDWASEYGSAFSVPTGLGGQRIAICDPKAAAHFYAKASYTYVNSELGKKFIENLLGKGLFWAEGDSHWRQRKALSPAFSNNAIRKLTPIFYDASYKLKSAWDKIIESSSENALIDVQKWMNGVSLDSVGIAGFGHDFGVLDGKVSSVAEVFASFGSETGTFSRMVFLASNVFPILQNLPTAQNKMLERLRTTVYEIAGSLLERNKVDILDDELEKSIIGVLVKAENSSSATGISRVEVMAQNALMLAGYETTSISLTWALIELCRHPEIQEKLRSELSEFSSTDPTWEQLASGLPYLEAMTNETLRVHPPVTEISRVTSEDDMMPLSTPVVTRSGETVSSLVIAKGTTVSTSIECMNRSEAFWGPDAKEFKPERWLQEQTPGTKDLPGYHHLLTFSDGPRLCLGKGFALAEFKAVLSVLIRNYHFELPDGPETHIGKYSSLLPRPRIGDNKGPQVHLRVKRV